MVSPASDHRAAEALFCSRSPWPCLRSADVRAYGRASKGSAAMLLRHIRVIAPEAAIGAKGGPHVALLGRGLASVADKELQAATSSVPREEGRQADVTTDQGRLHPGTDAPPILREAAADASSQSTSGGAEKRSRIRPQLQRGTREPLPEAEDAIRRLAGGAAVTSRGSGP